LWFDLDEGGVDPMKRLVLAILVVLSLAVAANAQTYRGAINGTVTDPSGAVVPNAQVKATEKSTGIDHNTVTTSDGLFVFQDLPTGTYKVTVTASGFAVLTVDNILVAQGAIYTLPAKLSLAQGTVTQIEVSAAALTLDTTTETQTTLVTGDDLQALPQNGRDFSQMIALAPGFGGYNVGGLGGGGGSINGTRWDQVNWQMDGVDNNDLWWNIPSVNQGGVSGIAGIILPTDAIDQFSVQTQAAPENGRSAGGNVDLALKSGGNDLHGTVYDYHRNEAFAAKSPFVGTKKRNRNYNYGFSLGGPILKDRLFFFTTFEKQRFSIGLPGEGTEPSTAYQNAALNVLNNCVNPPACTTHYGTYAPVPESSISKGLLATLWPSSTLSGPASPNNFTSDIPEFGFSYNGLAKFDYKINDKNNLSFHWFIGTGNQSAPVGGSALALPASQIPFYYEVAPIHVQNYAVSLNSVFTPKLTNQLLLGVNYFKQKFNDANNSFDVSACCGLTLAPNFSANGVTGAPRIIIGPLSGGGFDETGLTPPKGRQDVTGHITDAVSYTFGKHQVRFGGEYRRVQVDEFYHEGALGELVFDGTQAPWAGLTLADSNILPLADFMAGYLDTTSSSTVITLGNTERLIHIKTFSLFAQDAWKFSPKLTFNYGMRWDYEGPPGDGKNDLSVFIPSKGGLVTQGSGGIDSIYKKIYTNFSPRIGFAYQPKANGDLVVRAGFGVFFDTPRMNPFFDMHAPNGPSQGVEANPVGTIPVTTVTAVSLNTSGNAGQGTPWTSSPIFRPGPACPTGAASCGATYSIFTVTQNFHTPYTYNFNLNIEKALGKSLLWQVGYVGSASHHLLTLADINQPVLGIGARPFATQFPSFGVIDELQTAGNSNYHALQTVLKVREWHRLSSQFVYSWSHALDDMTQARGNLPQDSFNLKGDYGNSDTDSRHNFKALLNYDLPDGTRWKRLTSGWQLSSLVVLWTGQPFTVFSSSDTATGEGTQRANRVPGVNPFSGVNHSIVNVGGSVFEQWINPAAFVDPPAGTFGTSPRNGYRGPGFADVDFSVVKNTPITERVKAQFRIEMFNLFNRTNLATPSGTLGSSFGQSADTIGDFFGAPGIGPGEKFNMQLALKIIF
jgi:Carboxypeptidase regulatory-like domain/TonB dependent receptor